MNKYLLLFDIIFLPVTLVRLLLIYLWGSKYNVPNMSFLDVMLHADHPYFNQEGEMSVNTTNSDVRCFIYENSKLVLAEPEQNITDKPANQAPKEITKLSSKKKKTIKNIEQDDRMGVDVFGKVDDYSPTNNLMTELESDSDELLDTDAEESPLLPESDSDDEKRAKTANAKILKNKSLSDIDGMIDKVWDELDLDSDT
jgi:hypothetical protein